ncbi:hypothetical protein B0T19DRAFT_118132 [Cercophora scortea]|uniref:Uncharacterized protein n=1 Tax=Cercophora scortea TaxID=314031 RepID=A0AAE0MHU0_9PEZI|nr:hypothetical protein B0T19DRAFT_118132 [Cercophora scortea]
MHPGPAALAPGRRILRSLFFRDGLRASALTQVGRIAPPAHHHHHAPQPSQCRHYAKGRPAPSVVREKRSQMRGGSESRIFSEGDVPPIGFWAQRVPYIGPEDLTAEACFHAAAQYCALATNAGSTWKRTLQRDHDIDPYTLHYTAIMLLGGGDQPGETWRLGLHMLGTASDLDYAPSTLTFMRLMTKAVEDKSSRMRETKMYRSAESRFNGLVKGTKHPDAITLQGLRLRRQGDDSAALVHFNKAVEVGAKSGSKYAPEQKRARAIAAAEDPVKLLGKATAGIAASDDDTTKERPPRWNWEATCHVERGRILLKQGNQEAAKAAFRIAALELDVADGHLELGKILPSDSQEREHHLQKAAQSLNREACLLLADAEKQRALAAGLAAPQRKQHQKLADEWLLLAGNDADQAGESARMG